jgi:NSS family neurotransmitter:Na+ symporter
MHESRGQWASRFGFVLAAAGSAIGLGNIWKFPYITGVHGGGAFVFVYIGCILAIGVPILIAEISLGKLARRDPIGAMRVLAGRRSPWQLIGWMGIVAAFTILSFYSVVAGWALDFTVQSLLGNIGPGADPEHVRGLFGVLFASPMQQIAWHLLFMTMVVAIVAAGVQGGLERAGNWLMPALFLILMGLLVHSALLPSFADGWRFMFEFRTDSLTRAGVLEALGHSFFTLSLGMGAMMTYGSYLQPGQGVVRPAFMIAGLDTLIALVAGLVIFPVVFMYGLEPAGGPGLIFQTLPMAFQAMPGGSLVAFAFFLLLSFAALTSAISLLEVAVAFACDTLGWQRRRAAVLIGLTVAALGVPAAMFGGFFDFLDSLSSNYLLPLGGLGIALYTGHVLDRVRLSESELGARLGFIKLWLLILRWLSPLLVALVFLQKIGLIPLGGGE